MQQLIRDRGARQQLLLRKERAHKIFRLTVELEIAKLIVGSSVRPRRTSVWALSRSPLSPERTKRLQTA
jgi:lipocalin